MLIGTQPRRPNLELVRRIKEAIRTTLCLSEDATVTVTELACLEENCAPIETAIGLLRPGEQQLQHKLHKPVSSIDADDLTKVCEEWGFDARIPALGSFTKGATP